MGPEQKNSAELSKRQFQMVGGTLCLDFCNTMGGKRGGVAREHLQSYEDFLNWCEQAKVLSLPQSAMLREKAAKAIEAGEVALLRVRSLREALYRVFLSIAQNTSPNTEDIALLNMELSQGLGRRRVGPVEDGHFEWIWAVEPIELESPLAPLAESAARLLVSGEQHHQLHQCGGDNCGWLFLDTSKNHSRRWCDMRDCGNRAKVRRHRQRHESKGPGSS